MTRRETCHRKLWKLWGTFLSTRGETMFLELVFRVRGGRKCALSSQSFRQTSAVEHHALGQHCAGHQHCVCGRCRPALRLWSLSTSTASVGQHCVCGRRPPALRLWSLSTSTAPGTSTASVVAVDQHCAGHQHCVCGRCRPALRRSPALRLWSLSTSTASVGQRQAPMQLRPGTRPGCARCRGVLRCAARGPPRRPRVP